MGSRRRPETPRRPVAHRNHRQRSSMAPSTRQRRPGCSSGRPGMGRRPRHIRRLGITAHLYYQNQAATERLFSCPRRPDLLPGAAPPPKEHMTTEAIDLTARIQARDGVAVVVYTKNDCRQCDMTKGLLAKEGIHFTSVNVEE